MSQPIIGIPASTLYGDANYSKSIRNYVNQQYSHSIVNNGGLPFILPVHENLEILDAQLSHCDGFLFPGGEDVDPLAYNQEPHAKLGSIRPEIDAFQGYVMEYALNNNKPILGICRGLQLLNVIEGGTLYQDLSIAGEVNGHVQKADRHFATHTISIKEDTTLHSILNTTKTNINTFHHQAVDRLADGYKASAHAPDGIIEAIEKEGDIFVLAVQWHPEEMIDHHEDMNLLFKELIKKSK